MKRVHIVGLSPRTGTTLMMELMAHCFVFAGVPKHETSIFNKPAVELDTFCSKSPRELRTVLELGEINDLWCICMIRDPRDVVVSRHAQRPSEYWTDLRPYRNSYEAFRKLSAGYGRLLCIKYEELVADPDAVQERIMRSIPFLVEKAKFSAFHKIARPTRSGATALGGIRRISTASIGNWKNHLPRIKAQVQIHGDICEMLEQLGYEKDAGWLKLLDGVTADNGGGTAVVPSGVARARQYLRRKRKILLMRLGYQKKIELRA